MKEVIYVQVGQIKQQQGAALLQSTPLGSCVAVTAYDARHKVGAMAHVMLPGAAPAGESEPTRYAAEAIIRLTEEFSFVDSLAHLDVCLLGAANVLQRPEDTICMENQRSVTACLQRAKIPIRATALGGSDRRVAFLHTGTGRVSYTQAGQRARLLWDPCASGAHHD